MQSGDFFQPKGKQFVVNMIGIYTKTEQEDMNETIKKVFQILEHSHARSLKVAHQQRIACTFIWIYT